MNDLLEEPLAAHGVGLWDLVLAADIVVQAVMLSLVLASIWSWMVIFDRYFRLRRLAALASSFERAFWSGADLKSLFDRAANERHPLAAMYTAGYEEWESARRPSDPAGRANLVARVGTVMRLTLDRETTHLERNVGSLATIGAVAPFVGLFGTVWGIMNSFQSIAMAGSATLAVVAPGIAEALLATALGLAAAIPAVIFYNRLARDIDGYAGRLASFADEVSVEIDRQMDRQPNVPGRAA
ncbi:MAG: protein TolQ [Geminicoccaceae bacterium]|nr:MAG: protein TolQ [Geminicoccaceae bacterium]